MKNKEVRAIKKDGEIIFKKEKLKGYSKKLIIKKISSLFLSIVLIMAMIPNVVQAENKTVKNEKSTILKDKLSLLNTKFSVSDVPKDLLDKENVNIKNVKGIDDIDSLDLKSFTTINNDNSKTVHIFSEPIKYYDKEEKEIKFIDNTLMQSDKSKYAFENAANEFKVMLPESTNNGVIIEDEEDSSLKFKPVSKVIAKAENKKIKFLGQEEEVVEYKNIFGEGYNLQYIPLNDGVKENILITKNNGVYTFDFTIKAQGLIPKSMKGKTICFVKENQENVTVNQDESKSDNIAFTFGELYMRDSYVGNPDNNDHLSFDNYYKITDLGNYNYKITYVLDKSFLKKKSTQYPVLVDPTVSPATITTLSDAPVYSARSTQNFSTNAWIQIGKVGGSYGYGRGYFRTTAEQVKKHTYINSKNIKSANLRLYEGSGTKYTSKIRVFNNDDTWKAGSITYNNKPNLDGSAIATVSIKKSGFYNFPITSLVKDWLKNILGEGGYGPAYGVALVRDTSSDGRKDFCSANYGDSSKRPSITINYTEDTSIADNKYFITNYNSGLRLDVLRTTTGGSADVI